LRFWEQNYKLAQEAKGAIMIRNSSYMNYVNVGDGTSVLFSGISSCVDLVPQNYVESMTKNDFSILSNEEKDHLVKRGHLTTLSRKQELDAFKKQARFILNKNAELMKKKRQKLLCFFLTYDCNLSCKYCYQKTLSNKLHIPPMSAEFTDRILTQYLPKLFPKASRNDNISFVLFGGEPLLPSNKESILRILQYAKRHSVKIGISTNAIYVPQMIDSFGREYGKIQNVQVTLDGDRPYHNSQRIPSSGKPTFDNMISAIRMLKKANASVLVRIHTHPEQMNSTRKLVKYLDKEKIIGDNVKMYFSPLNDFQNCSKEDLSIFEKLFENVSKKTNFPPSSSLDFLKTFIEMQEEKILLRIRFCSLGNNTFRIIDPIGDIYECYEEVGDKKRRIGTISDGKLKFFPLKKSYSKRNILNIPECLKCSLALFCGGGCPTRARTQTGSIFKPYCHQNKEYIKETLKAYFLSRTKLNKKGVETNEKKEN
jgi:uncharacterized protein